MNFNRAKLAPQTIGNISAESKLVEKAKVHKISDSVAEAIQLLFLKNSRLKQMISVLNYWILLCPTFCCLLVHFEVVCALLKKYAVILFIILFSAACSHNGSLPNKYEIGKKNTKLSQLNEVSQNF